MYVSELKYFLSDTEHPLCRRPDMSKLGSATTIGC